MPERFKIAKAGDSIFAGKKRKTILTEKGAQELNIYRLAVVSGLKPPLEDLLILKKRMGSLPSRALSIEAFQELREKFYPGLASYIDLKPKD